MQPGTHRLNLDACTDRERALITYAIKLNDSPSEVTKSDLQIVRDAGVSDRGLHDLVNCIAYFAYANRVVAGLGVRPGGKEGLPGQ